MALTIIIGYHNEPLAEIQECVDQIQSTIDISEYEVLVVDDGSANPLQGLKGATVIRHNVNKGIGGVFDTGAERAKYDNLFLMGNDIRFLKNGWASKIEKEVEEHPRAFTCTACVKLGRSNPNDKYATDIEDQIKHGWYTIGATIKVWSDKTNTEDKTDTFRSCLDAQWLPVPEKNLDLDSYEVPCILGAAYGVKKDFYKHIDGWEGHRRWGTLEPYISLKAWLLGGSCRVAPRVQVGHIYKCVNPHGVGQKYILYNKYLTATLLIENHHDFIEWMKEKYKNPHVDKWMEEDKGWMSARRMKYRDMKAMSFDDYCKKFNIDNKQPTPQQK